MKKSLISVAVLTILIIVFALCSCSTTSQDKKDETFAKDETKAENVTEVAIETHQSTEKATEWSTEVPVETQQPTEKATEKATEKPTEVPTQPPVQSIEQKVEDKLASMTLKEKVYQMMIVLPEQLTGSSNVTVADIETKTALEKYPVGGVIYFANNLITPSQTKAMISNTLRYGKEVNGLPLFMCIDEEGGRVARIGNNSAFGVVTFPNAGLLTSDAQAGIAGDTIGAYLKEYGFNVDFAPDADVLTNPVNSVIGERSFSSDPFVVTRRALAFAKGLKNNGVLATYKHFPGHGATEGDTHEGFAYTNKTLEQLKVSELMPFESAAQNNIDFIMTAHISVPNVVGDNTPTSLSYKMVTTVLREQIGYSGLIVTDSLRMGAVTKVYTDKEIAVMAVQAGNDILLMPKDMEASANAIIDAVENKKIKLESINESVKKILKVKYTMR